MVASASPDSARAHNRWRPSPLRKKEWCDRKDCPPARRGRRTCWRRSKPIRRVFLGSMPSSSRTSVSNATLFLAEQAASQVPGLLPHRALSPDRSEPALPFPPPAIAPARPPRLRFAVGKASRELVHRQPFAPWPWKQAPAIRPARPVRRMIRFRRPPAPATPITRLKLETRPSFAPSTAARQRVPRGGTVAGLPTRRPERGPREPMMTGGGRMDNTGRGSARRPTILRPQASGWVS